MPSNIWRRGVAKIWTRARDREGGVRTGRPTFGAGGSPKFGPRAWCAWGVRIGHPRVGEGGSPTFSGPRPTHVRRSSVLGTSRSRSEGGGPEHPSNTWRRVGGAKMALWRESEGGSGRSVQRPTLRGCQILETVSKVRRGGSFGARPTLSPPPFAYLPRESTLRVTFRVTFRVQFRVIFEGNQHDENIVTSNVP